MVHNLYAMTKMETISLCCEGVSERSIILSTLCVVTVGRLF